MKDVYMFYPFEGVARYWSGFRENNLSDENGRLDGKAGVYIEYREEDFDNFMEFVDALGMPASESIPSNVMDIIYEEISAY